MTRLRRLIAEIHRRSLWQTLGIYAVGSWLVFEVITNLVQGLRLPEWLPALAVVLFLIGLPIVLATAFVQEGLPSTPSRDPTLLAGYDIAAAEAAGNPAPPAAPPGGAVSRVGRLLTWRNAVAGGVGAFAIWGLIAAGWILAGAGQLERAAAEARPTVAVLPLDNLSAEEEDRYFTDGMHEELIANLAHVSGLRVISRTSVMEYRDSPKNLRQIAQELGADYIVEGSVRRAGERVRITAQLIAAETDAHLFAESYERSRGDVFAIQADVARRIAQATQAELTPTEERALERVPTTSAAAHDFFLQGLEYQSRGLQAGAEGPGNLALAERLFEQALELDPGFTDALAGEAHTLLAAYWYGYRREPAVKEEARELVDRALELAPDLAVAHQERGYYLYWGERDYEGARRAFLRALELQPNSIGAQGGLGFVLRRQGRFAEAAPHIAEASRLQPRSPKSAWEAAVTLLPLGQYDSAAAFLNRARAIDPGFAGAYAQLAGIRLLRSGDVTGALAVLDSAAPFVDAEELWELRYILYLARGRYEDALAQVGLEPDSVVLNQIMVNPLSLYRGAVHRLAGRPEAARQEFESAARLLERMLAADSTDYRVHGSLAVAYAGLGRADAAVHHARRATEILPVSMDALTGPGLLLRLAEVYTMLGRNADAVRVLERVLAAPQYEASATSLRVDARFQDLRGRPDFEALLASTT